VIIIKNKKQIEGIRKASLLTAKTLDMIGKYVQPGISTEELDTICNNYIMNNWGSSACIWYYDFPKYTCISLNDTICHGIPSTSEILQEWDILNIDVTTIVDGYFWDASRMYTVGKISDKARELIQVTHDCWKIWIEEIKPWARFWKIWYKISKYAESRGYSVVRDYTWHGVGVNFHEDPYVYHKADKHSWAKMKPWMIFTVEPMINIGGHETKILADKWTVKTKDSSLTAQWEHTILVTDTWYEILTKTDRDFGFEF